MTITNAGSPPAREPQVSGIGAAVQELTTPRWVYAIVLDDADIPIDRRRVGYGTDIIDTDPGRLAEMAAGLYRGEFPHMNAHGLIIYVWPRRPDGEEHYRTDIPMSAYRYHYPHGTPA